MTGAFFVRQRGCCALARTVIFVGVSDIYVTGSMRFQLVCNDPRVVVTSLNDQFVCNDPRDVTK